MIREVILKTAGMFDNYDHKLTDYELWKSIAEYMDGEKALVVDHYTRDGTYTFLGLQDPNKDKEYAYMREQDSMMGCYIDDRERFEKDWENEEYESDGLFILSAENVITSEAREAHIPHDLPGQQEGDKWNPVSFMLGTSSNKLPGQQDEIKGCSGECDFCPDADGCEQCGSV
ncbi:hypothetical protein [Lacrimispora sp.]|uniref:hypothetical protein n=1 Tax=Lacrimispora sp. TaxID=2719234 RepID=UPI0026A3BFC7|nr:hypothetical protein [Lacrimispora sp.]